MKKEKHIDIVFDRLPGVEGPRFIEVEDAQGQSISIGEWIIRNDNYAAIRIPDFRTLASELEQVKHDFLDVITMLDRARISAGILDLEKILDGLKQKHGWRQP